MRTGQGAGRGAVLGDLQSINPRFTPGRQKKGALSQRPTAADPITKGKYLDYRSKAYHTCKTPEPATQEDGVKAREDHAQLTTTAPAFCRGHH